MSPSNDLTSAVDMTPMCIHDTDCTNGGKAPCGGSCNGGVCVYPGANVDCGSTCAGNKETPKVCDGNGACVTGAQIDCGVYQCGATTCKTTCTNAATDCNGTPCTNNQCVACPGDMVYVSAGTFIMGHNYPSSTTDAQVTVTLTKAFCIDKYEVTVAQYRACVTAGVCTVPASSSFGDYTPAPSANDNLPIGNVSWAQANTYCTWTGLGGGARSLPTEAQWERAARGTDGRTYPWGEATPDCTYLDYKQTTSMTCLPSAPWLAVVGSYPKGVAPTGIYDAAGNAFEFTADCWVANYTKGGVCNGSCTDPTAPPCAATADHTARGGSSSSPVGYIETYYRYDMPAAGDVNVGFRCAK